MKLNSPATRVIASVLVVLQVGVLPAAAAAPPAAAVTANPTAAPRFEVNRSAPALRTLPTEPSFSADPSDSEIVRARVFAEPFVPVAGARQSSENVDLARIIRDQTRSSTPDDVTRFEVFLRDHPTSRWSGAVLLGLGIVYRQTGYLTRALERFERAWTLLEKETEPRAKALGDRALAELADLNASLGRAERVVTLFEAARKRDIRGPAAEKFAATENVVAAARLEVRRAFRCGPMALERALSTGTLTDAARQRILKEGSTEKGTSLSQLLRLSQAIDVPMQMAWREPGAEVITPAVVHWKSGHFAAITADDGRRSRVDDPVLGGEMSVSRPALDEEASGAFLVPVGPMPNGWRPLSGAEGDLFWGRGETSGPERRVFGSCPWSRGGGGRKCSTGPCRMADYKVNLLLVNLHVSDSPVGYDPPVGPSMQFTLAYNQREYFQPQIPSYSNFGPKWSFGWFSYVEDTPTDPNQSPNVYLKLGGVETYYNYDASSQTYGTHYSSRAVLARTSSTAYERRLPDGSVEVFAQPDGSTVYPRRVFLTAIRDPQGNQVNFGYTYDVPTGALLLSSATDKIGQVTTFQYGGSDPRKITRVTDPFGRYASFEYDPTGRLSRITDVIGITSEFTYGTNDFISSLTTPYGTTTFQTGMSGTDRWLEATDALGAKERIEYRGATTAISSTEPVVPSAPGLATTNAFIYARNTFYWDKRAMASMPYSIDYRKARITHWLHSYFNNSESSGTIESEKAPLENRIWYNYPGQPAPAYEGTSINPTIVARVLDDGTTQVYRYEYNSLGKVIKATDPSGRETKYTYGTGSTPDANQATGTGLDLLKIEQKNPASPGGYDLLASFTYNGQHQPLTVTDIAGQTTTYTYNAQGQRLTMETPPRAGITENRITTRTYDTNGYLQTIARPAVGATTGFTYDGYGRVRTATNEEAYTVTLDYDALDRPTRATFPNGTYEETVYNRLDAERHRDRMGRWTHTFHDALRRVVARQDSLGQTTTQQWCTCGSMDKLIDANNNATTWERDLEGRVTKELRQDGTSTQYVYESTTSRLKQITDPKLQVTTLDYFGDDALKQITYTNTQNPTPAVSFTYDPNYARTSTVADVTGTTTYGYQAVASPPALGAGRLSTVNGPFANDTITYAYDELGRTKSREINGVISTRSYDLLGRVTGEANPLGTFTYAYVGTTSRLASTAYPNGQTTSYAYYENVNDHRLQEIHNHLPGGATLSKFNYGYDAGNKVNSWTQQAGTNAPGAYDLGYDPTDQLSTAVFHSTDPTPVTLKRYAYGYDKAGNRTTEQIDDGISASTVNNMNRVIQQDPGGSLRFKGTVNEAAGVTVQGKPASVTADNRFEGQAQVSGGTNAVAVTATDPSGNVRTNTYQVAVAGTSKSFTYDANGNLTGDGTRTFEWDGADRLLAINQGTRRSEFTYDGLGRRVRIVEKDNAAVLTDRRLLWCGAELCEERDATGATVTKRFFNGGMQDGTDLFFTVTDHLGSIREMSDSTGAIRARYEYDPYGRRTKVSGDRDAVFGFTGLYVHVPSGLNLALYRAYDADMGRWLSQDPLGLQADTDLYRYVVNNPSSWTDPLGLTTFQCQRQVQGAPPPAWWNLWMIHHDWLCVFRDGQWHCGGQTPTPGQEPEWWQITTVVPGTNASHAFGPKMCTAMSPHPASQGCFEVCVIERIESPSRPPFSNVGLNGGTNCQQWVNDVITYCKQICTPANPSPNPQPAPPPGAPPGGAPGGGRTGE